MCARGLRPTVVLGDLGVLGRRRWEFREEKMAPVGRNTLYGRVEGVARILPSALFAARSLMLRRTAEDIHNAHAHPANARPAAALSRLKRDPVHRL